MASPQKENGYTAISNEIMERIIASSLNGTELACVLFILRKTYGYQKKEDEISLSQFTKAIPVSKQSIVSALNNLQLVKIIRLVKKGNSQNCSNLWVFNKDYDDWQLVKKYRLVKISNSTSKDFYKQLVKKPLHTKETIQKKYTKEISQLTNLLYNLIKENNPTFKEPNINSWSEHIDKMIRLDKRTEAQIEYVIKWCQADSFWKANILSTQKLRDKFDTLVAQIKRNKDNSKGITII